MDGISKKQGEDRMKEDENNFKFQLGIWNVVMADGELEINDYGYQEEPEDDPTYALVREIWRLRNDHTS